MSRVILVADYPAWLLPGMDHLPPRKGHATWLHMLRPHFGELASEFDIHWLVMTKGVSESVEIVADGQTFHLLPRKRKIVAMLTAYFFESRMMTRLLDRLRPDLVHAWGTEDAYAMCAAGLTKWPVLFSLQGCITECLRVGPAGALMRLQGIYERHALKRLSRATGESARACANMHAIHPGMTTEVVDYGVSREFLEIVRNPSEEPHVCYVGGVYAGKGVPELIEVMARPSLSGIHLDVYGTGPELEALQAVAPVNVQFHGHVSRDQLKGVYASSWALVAPTHCDTGPTVVKEARAAGLPVVTTSSAGASCHVVDGHSGHIISPGDKDALERAILSVCASRDISLGMGLHDLVKLRCRLDGSTTVTAFASIYRAMLQGPSSGSRGGSTNSI